MARVLIVEDDPASMDLALRIVRLQKRFRREPWAEHIPVIAVSASATPPERARAVRAGCDDFRAKNLPRTAAATGSR